MEKPKYDRPTLHEVRTFLSKHDALTRPIGWIWDKCGWMNQAKHLIALTWSSDHGGYAAFGAFAGAKCHA